MTNPKYPVYIPSKGRWTNRFTARALEAMGVPYFIVVEEPEYNNYAEFIDPKRILVLPFVNRGLIAARNWIREHATASGAKRHWQMDDNITEFYWMHKNVTYLADSGAMFRIMEDFSDRYTNVAFSGPQYSMFVPRKQKVPPLVFNTRVYSCTLVNNSIPYTWRSVYNDDTDISLCALKDGWCTVLFNVFQQRKLATMRVHGGNTDDLYLIEDGRLKMAMALQKLHPDVTTVRRRWGRWQHVVDYSSFRRNKLLPRPGLRLKPGHNWYGVELQKRSEPFRKPAPKAKRGTI